MSLRIHTPSLFVWCFLNPWASLNLLRNSIVFYSWRFKGLIIPKPTLLDRIAFYDIFSCVFWKVWWVFWMMFWLLLGVFFSVFPVVVDVEIVSIEKQWLYEIWIFSDFCNRCGPIVVRIHWIWKPKKSSLFYLVSVCFLFVLFSVGIAFVPLS